MKTSDQMKNEMKLLHFSGSHNYCYLHKLGTLLSSRFRAQWTVIVFGVLVESCKSNFILVCEENPSKKNSGKKFN